MTVPRRATYPEELPVLAELFDRVRMADGHRPIGEHILLELSTGPGAGLIGLVLEDEGQLVAYAGLAPALQPGWWTLELAVHPSWRRREVFRTLLEAAIGEATVKEGTAIRLWTLLPHLVDTALVVGFRPERELRCLQLDLPYLEMPEYPTGVIVGPFRPRRDQDEWLEVNNAAFAGHPENGNWTAEVLTRKMGQTWFDEADMIVARLHEKLIGFCWTKREDPEKGEIYVIAVDPAHQGQGLGRALLIDGLTNLSRAKANSVDLYVDSGNDRATRLYESVGFRLDHVDRSFVKTL